MFYCLQEVVRTSAAPAFSENNTLYFQSKTSIFIEVAVLPLSGSNACGPFSSAPLSLFFFLFLRHAVNSFPGHGWAKALIIRNTGGFGKVPGFPSVDQTGLPDQWAA